MQNVQLDVLLLKVHLQRDLSSRRRMEQMVWVRKVFISLWRGNANSDQDVFAGRRGIARLVLPRYFVSKVYEYLPRGSSPCWNQGISLLYSQRTSPVATWGALVGLAPPNKTPSPQNWNMKHYELVEFLSNLDVKPRIFLSKFGCQEISQIWMSPARM